MLDFLERFPNEISGGQAQRAALARAFALQPKVIMIDEAHSGLDLEQQEVLNSHLLTLRANDTGLILVTHSLEFAMRYADCVVVLESGVISEVGGREIFDEPKSLFLRRVLKLREGVSIGLTGGNDSVGCGSLG